MLTYTLRILKQSLGLAALVLFIILINVSSVFAQSEDALVKAVNARLIPLRTVLPDTGFADMMALKPFIKDKQVFALGEATHGTSEFFSFKHRMLQFLVKEMGVRTFVIEGDFAGAQIMNDYVLHGKGDANKGLMGIGFGVWMTQEVVDMANWMKAYNATQTPDNKVTFWGCDMQWGATAMQALKAHLLPGNQFSPAMEEGLKVLNKYLIEISRSDKKILNTAIAELERISFNDVDTAIYKHYITAIKQTAELLDSKSKIFPTRSSDVRDRYMAENCRWIYNYTGHKKMMIWAHNEHIVRAPGSYSYVRMGMHLSKVWKDDYYAMGFELFSGKMNSFDVRAGKAVTVTLPSAQPGFSSSIFAAANAPNFIIDLKMALNNPILNTYFHSKTGYYFIGAGYIPQKEPNVSTRVLANSYDAIIFIKETTPAKEIVTSRAN